MKNTNQGAQDKTEREATATIKQNRLKCFNVPFIFGEAEGKPTPQKKTF